MRDAKMKIFIGSSSEAADKANPNNILLKVAEIIRGANAQPIAWNDNDYDLFSIGNTTIENLETIVTRENIKASVFIYSADDKVWWRAKINSNAEEKNAPRDNVLFEHGLFSGILGRKKSIIIKYGNVDKIPSDLHGVTYIDLSDDNKEIGTRKLIRWVRDLLNSEQNNNYKHKKNRVIDIIIPETIQEEKTSNFGKENCLIELISIPKGTYRRLIDDKEININHSLSISKNLITQSAYHSIMDNDPSHFKGEFLPVENISFREAIIFCNKLSIKDGYQEVYTIVNDEILWNEKAKGYRLPFEIEWEYALGYNIKEIQENLNTYAWYFKNSDNETHDVGLKKENKYKLFDLLGNVWEWCFDNYKDNPPQSMVLENNNIFRVLRGGSFADFENRFTKKAFRIKEDESNKNKFTGFRIVLQNINMEV